MEQKDFKHGQTLYSLTEDGQARMCVFNKKEGENSFSCTNLCVIDSDGTCSNVYNNGLCFYIFENKLVQWQLATMEQIKQYGYEKHLDHSVQFPDAKPEKELDIKERLRWIALSEQLPPVGKDVVFARFEGQGVIWYAVNKAHEKFTGESTRSTHWCDCLPDAPNPTKKEAVVEPEKVQEQPKPERVTLEQLLTEPKYREMSEAELWDIIGDELLYEDYEELEGTLAIDKTRNLKEKWAKEEAEKTRNPTELGAVSETSDYQSILTKEAPLQNKDLHAWAIPQTQEGVISTFEYKEPEPQPFTVTEDMWVEMDDLVRGLSIRIQMLSDKLKRKA
jgi:hypothetical protein